MKLFVVLLFLLVIGNMLFQTQPASAMCIVNIDWPNAPCLDMTVNGRYVQEDVNRWAEYYWYKGAEVMEAKYLELDHAIYNGNLENWKRDSPENNNVYQYYFFSGRAPNSGEYHGYFDIIQVYEPDHANTKQNFLNFQPILSFGGIIFLEELIILGIIGVGIGGFVIWRKRK